MRIIVNLDIHLGLMNLGMVDLGLIDLGVVDLGIVDFDEHDKKYDKKYL